MKTRGTINPISATSRPVAFTVMADSVGVSAGMTDGTPVTYMESHTVSTWGGQHIGVEALIVMALPW